ncbi:class I SAM-dependent methyltransferase [Halobium salinum]|uniref:Class I SAM-dependent methyltransferase n=1 Tax=Halobium salinum TaxID=1364940 RepID=A0ABD5P9E4_9EURY|nr:methyltransferase [Halobium salinum]
MSDGDDLMDDTEGNRDDAGGDSERREVNRRNWDERAEIHPDADYYDVEGFLAGESSLKDIEREELAVEGTRLLHLMCHNGLDTLSWAREGADVVGLDFSATALATAREIRDAAGIDPERARFVESDVYDAAETVPDVGSYDLVVATYGVLGWLPDLERLAEVAADCLAPGGAFYLVDGHPLVSALWQVESDGSEDGGWPYWNDGPHRIDEQGTYADPDAELENQVNYQWPHSMGEIVSAVAEAGLRVEFLHEFDRTDHRQVEGMVQGDDGWWRHPEYDVPFTFSLKARKSG